MLEGFLVDFSLMSLQSPVDAITVLRQFPFSSGLQRMSVIAQLAGDIRLQVYMKGAPEMVARFCQSETGTDFIFQWKNHFKCQTQKANFCTTVIKAHEDLNHQLQ